MTRKDIEREIRNETRRIERTKEKIENLKAFIGVKRDLIAFWKRELKRTKAREG